MFKQFMNTGSLKSLMLFENEGSARDQVRAALMAETQVSAISDHQKESINEQAKEVKEEIDSKDVAETTNEEKEVESETIATEENSEEKAKEQRKQERMQQRINRITAEKKAAEDEIAALKAQLAANPDKALTDEEVERRAEAKAAAKFAEKQLEQAQREFQESCDRLQASAVKIDKEFDVKVGEMAAELGPIPSRIIGILDDFKNGAEVLNFMVNDLDKAEEIYKLQNKPEKLALALKEIADSLKPKPKPISKVPDPIKPINGSRTVSNAITEDDAKNIDSYVAKRRQQMIDKRKAGGML